MAHRQRLRVRPAGFRSELLNDPTYFILVVLGATVTHEGGDRVVSESPVQGVVIATSPLLDSKFGHMVSQERGLLPSLLG